MTCVVLVVVFIIIGCGLGGLASMLVCTRVCVSIFMSKSMYRPKIWEETDSG